MSSKDSVRGRDRIDGWAASWHQMENRLELKSGTAAISLWMRESSRGQWDAPGLCARERHRGTARSN